MRVERQHEISSRREQRNAARLIGSNPGGATTETDIRRWWTFEMRLAHFVTAAQFWWLGTRCDRPLSRQIHCQQEIFPALRGSRSAPAIRSLGHLALRAGRFGFSPKCTRTFTNRIVSK